MPAALDHYRFALESPLDGFDRGAVLLGTQGPDPFYFNGLFSPRVRPPESRSRLTADFMHDADPAHVFIPLAARVSEADTSKRRILASFLYGLLLHYLLDRAMHPYVYYRTGFDSEGRTYGAFMADHSRFESAMAALGSARSGNTAPADPRVLFASDPVTLAVADELLAKAYPFRLKPGDYRSSWREMKSVFRLLHHRSAPKRFALRIVGSFVPMAGAMAIPALTRKEDDLDYLNDIHSPWRYPDSGEISHASVAELRAAALSAAPAAAAFAREAAVGSPPDPAAAARLFGGINHEGRPAGARPRFFESVYGRRGRSAP